MGGRPERGWRSTAGLALLLAWFGFLAFGGFGHAEAVRLGPVLRVEGVRTPADLLPLIRGYPSNDGDVRRAWSYGRAALGRSYLGFYVRTEEEWAQAYAAGIRGETAGEVVPAAPLRPWRDYLVEYPPGYFVAVLPPAVLAASPDVYRTLFVLEMACCALAALWLVESIRRRAAPAGRSVLGWGAVSMVLVGLILTHRMDALVSLELAFLLWSVVRPRPAAAGLATALLFWTKGVPALAASFLALPWVRERRWAPLARWALVACCASVALWAPAIWIGGGGLAQAARYQLQRPVEVESTAAALSGLVRTVVPGAAWPVVSHGAIGVRGPVVTALAAASQLLLLAGWAWVALRARGHDAGAQAATATTALVLWMVLGPVFSPQFFVWVLPAALLAGALAGGRALPALAGLCALHQLVYPMAIEHLRTLEPWACGLVLLRNVGLGAWAGWVFSKLQPTVLPGAPVEAAGATAHASSPMTRS